MGQHDLHRAEGARLLAHVVQQKTGGLASGHRCSPLRHPTAPTAKQNPARTSPNALFTAPRGPPTHRPTRATQPHRLKVCVESPILPSLGKFDAGGAVVIASARRFAMIGICLTLY